MKISIALCTYNGERFLPEQLESYLRQTRKPDQIVVHDDVSQDGTWAVLEVFKRRAVAMGIRVDLYRNPENLGYRKNFEAALTHATGDLIFLSDQDDIWHADKLAWYSEEFRRRPKLGLYHSDARLVDINGRDMNYGLYESLEISADELAKEHGGDAFNVLLRRNVATGATIAVRREVVAAALPMDDELIHDEWLALIASVISTVDCTERPSMDYRQHGSNQIGARIRTEEQKLTEGRHLTARDHMRMKAERMGKLVARLQGTVPNFHAEKIFQLSNHSEHLHFRADIPRTVFKRLPLIYAEAKNKNYWKYASGWRSIAVDILGLK